MPPKTHVVFARDLLVTVSGATLFAPCAIVVLAADEQESPPSSRSAGPALAKCPATNVVPFRRPMRVA